MRSLPDSGMLIVIGVPTALLCIHMVLSGVIWRRFTLRSSLLLLGGLAIFTSLLWWIVWFLVDVFVLRGLSSDIDTTSPASHVHAWMFETLRPCEYFPQIKSAVGLKICQFLPFLVMGIILFLLTLPLGMIACYRPRGNRSSNETTDL